MGQRGMHTVDIYAQVRRYVAVGHHSQRAAARYFGVSRDMVSKMMENAQPPGYRRTARVARPRLDPFMVWITETLTADQGKHRKQRHTAQRLFERLRDEHGYTGGATVVRDVVREHVVRGQEMFVPLVHPPGHAQVDFGEAVVIVGGVEQKGHFLAMDLPYSDAPFVMIFPRETPARRSRNQRFMIVSAGLGCCCFRASPRTPRTMRRKIFV